GPADRRFLPPRAGRGAGRHSRRGHLRRSDRRGRAEPGRLQLARPRQRGDLRRPGRTGGPGAGWCAPTRADRGRGTWHRGRRISRKGPHRRSAESRREGRLLKCPSCNAENDPTAESCFTCGKSFSISKGSVIAQRYEILSLLGKGGMGMVYRARDRVLDETVVLKTMRSQLAGDADMVRRFRAEV